MWCCGDGSLMRVTLFFWKTLNVKRREFATLHVLFIRWVYSLYSVDTVYTDKWKLKTC